MLTNRFTADIWLTPNTYLDYQIILYSDKIRAQSPFMGLTLYKIRPPETSLFCQVLLKKATTHLNASLYKNDTQILNIEREKEREM